MTGHEPILAMRRAGRAPRYVWVTDHRDGFLDGVTVRLSAADVPEQLDLRFLVGLTAIVEGSDPERVRRIAAACQSIARRVIATTSTGRDVVQITDTDEVLTWPN